MNYGSPLKPKKEPKAKPKPKPTLTRAMVKVIVGREVGETGRQWVESWIEIFLRERSLPLSLVGPTFLSGLEALYPLDEAVKIVERLRAEYETKGPVSLPADTPQSVPTHSLLRALKSRRISPSQTSLETTESPPEE